MRGFDCKCMTPPHSHSQADQAFWIAELAKFLEVDASPEVSRHAKINI